jgi:hypothetical protein
LPPTVIAKLLHGDVVWLARTQGLWTAVLLFNRPQRVDAPANSTPIQTYAASGSTSAAHVEQPQLAR